MTLQELIKTVRDLSYDRFPIPAIGIKGTGNITDTLTLSSTTLISVGSIPYNHNLASNITLESLATSLIGSNDAIAYLPAYRPDEITDNLIRFSSLTRQFDKFIFLKNFYSDFYITDCIVKYLTSVLGLDGVTPSNVSTFITDINSSPNPTRVFLHLQYFCALWLVDLRRMFEYSTRFYSLLYTDGSTGAPGSQVPSFSYMSNNADGDSINVQIGSVFSLNDVEHDGANTRTDYSGSPSHGSAGLAGTEMFFDDENSFWYRYYCWLRDKLEQQFQDFSFRKENGVWGTTTLLKDLSLRTYFDSFPLTGLGPRLRGL